MAAIFEHEMNTYYHSIATYLFDAFLLVFVGVGCLLYNIQNAVANFEYVLQFVSIGLVVIVPVLTMKVISEEKKQKTDQLLYSLPLTGTQIVIGKYLAVVCVFLLPMLIICMYPLVFAQFGDVYLPTSYGSLFAFFLMGCALIAIGTFISSLTDNQGFAAGISIPVILFNYYSVSLAEYVSDSAAGTLIALVVIGVVLGLIVKQLTQNETFAYVTGGAVCAVSMAVYLVKSSLLEGILPEIMSALSLFDRFSNFVNGVFDLTSIVFYLTVIVFFLFMTVQSVEKRRYN